MFGMTNTFNTTPTKIRPFSSGPRMKSSTPKIRPMNMSAESGSFGARTMQRFKGMGGLRRSIGGSRTANDFMRNERRRLRSRITGRR